MFTGKVTKEKCTQIIIATECPLPVGEFTIFRRPDAKYEPIPLFSRIVMISRQTEANQIQLSGIKE
jgi:hypothetical protein